MRKYKYVRVDRFFQESKGLQTHMDWCGCDDGGKVIGSQFVPVVEGLLSDDLYFGGICNTHHIIL